MNQWKINIVDSIIVFQLEIFRADSEHKISNIPIFSMKNQSSSLEPTSAIFEDQESTTNFFNNASFDSDVKKPDSGFQCSNVPWLFYFSTLIISNSISIIATFMFAMLSFKICKANKKSEEIQKEFKDAKKAKRREDSKAAATSAENSTPIFNFETDENRIDGDENLYETVHQEYERGYLQLQKDSDLA